MVKKGGNSEGPSKGPSVDSRRSGEIRNSNPKKLGSLAGHVYTKDSACVVRPSSGKVRESVPPPKDKKR